MSNKLTPPTDQPDVATYGLMGNPLGHSFSARYFTEKFEREGLRARYINLAYPSIEDEIEAISGLTSFRGFNVTIPYKQDIIPYLETLSPDARAIGAVNTVRVSYDAEGKKHLQGYNTDYIGFDRSIAPFLKPDVHTKALILGTGGASRAVKYALEQRGIKTTYVSRTPAEGRLTYADLTPEVMRDYHVLVNCSPVGMYPKVNAAPDIPYDLLTSDHLLYDLVYNPEETLFLQKGRTHGAVVKGGLEMLHLQADAAWEIWNAPVC